MRDPKRIEKILNILKEIWEKNPDLRFTQLISNLLDPVCPEKQVFSNSYLFYIEDTQFKNLLETYRDHITL